jgi:hypothetical protein
VNDKDASMAVELAALQQEQENTVKTNALYVKYLLYMLVVLVV